MKIMNTITIVLLTLCVVVAHQVYSRGGHGGGHGHHRGHGGHHGGHRGHHGGHRGHHGAHHGRHGRHGYHHFYRGWSGNRNYVNWWWGTGLAWPYGFYQNRRYVYPRQTGFWGFYNTFPHNVIIVANNERFILEPHDTADIPQTRNNTFTVIYNNKPYTFNAKLPFVRIINNNGVPTIKAIK